MTWTAASDRYDTMQYRRCGRRAFNYPLSHLDSGITSAASITKKTVAIVRRADAGITHFDLDGPPPGSAEEFSGSHAGRRSATYRDELIISTKAGFPMWPGPYGQLGSRKYLWLL